MGVQYALMVPKPGKSDVYYTFYSTRDRSNIFYNNYMIRFALFNVSHENKEGKSIRIINVIMNIGNLHFQLVSFIARLQIDSD